MDSLTQTIFPWSDQFPLKINIRKISMRHVGDAVRYLMPNMTPAPSDPLAVGIACHTTDTGAVDFITLANTNTVFLVFLDSHSVVTNRDFASLCYPSSESLPPAYLAAFSMAKVAVKVSQATHLRIKGVDLLTLHSPDTWKPKSPVDVVTSHVSAKVDKWSIISLWLDKEESIEADTCLKAWLAACVGSRLGTQHAAATRVDMKFLNVTERDLIADLISQSERLERLKPKEAPTEFIKATQARSGRVDLINSRYKTRIRRSDQTRIVMTDTRGQEYFGNAQAAKGKTTTIKMQGNLVSSEIASIKVIGRHELTNSERARDELIHRLLTGQINLRRSPFIRAVWFPKWKTTTLAKAGCESNPKVQPDCTAATVNLNDSQKCVVREMVCGAPIVVTHGPPGTGKTTTISAASQIWDLHGESAWIVAHSNVAVKNIAEALAKKEVNFKLIVSKEFHHEWHEHIYTSISKALILSDELPDNVADMGRILKGSRIILCTLSMLSNPLLHDNGTFTILPVEKLIVDEASQISTFDFLHLFVKFQKTLEKVCFFGDPKQLPPYGKDNIPTMKTIFDMKHITNEFFLDTQYRIPAPVGDFISNAVYAGRLRSVHPIQGKACLAFVNVDLSRGAEEKNGFSWKNVGEIQTIVHIVKNYYKTHPFTIITPYDGQRAAIQKALSAERLPWESVYNIDSFQGNENDFIIISVVRSQFPGFLSSLNRLNVLLTRFKKGMVIVSSRRFMQFGGSQTLLGELSRHWQIKSPTDIWLDWRDIAGGSVDLPGVLAPHRARGTPATTYWSTQLLQPPAISTLATPWPCQSSSRGFDVSKLFPPLPQRSQKEGDKASGNSVHLKSRDTTFQNKTYASCAAAAPKSTQSVRNDFIQVRRPPTNSLRSYQKTPTTSLSSSSLTLPKKPIGRKKTPQIAKTRGNDSSNRYALLATLVLS